MASAVQRFTGLSVPQRAADLLAPIAAQLSQPHAATDMPHLLNAVMPEWVEHQPEQFYSDRLALLWRFRETFQVLLLARLLASMEQMDSNGFATGMMYFLTSDGQAALDRGDVVDVVTRRVPE